jgi:hypothetical protein
VEHVTIPVDYAAHHYLRFTFPYSHGLLASVLWSVLGGGLAWLVTSQFGRTRWRAALLIGAAVYSHWLLDALVHIPELPLTGPHSAKVGLALWEHMPLALTLEMVITAVGLGLYVWGSLRNPRHTTGVIVLTVALMVATIGGMTVAPAPTDIHQLAVVSLMSNLVIIVIAWWLGGSSTHTTSA